MVKSPGKISSSKDDAFTVTPEIFIGSIWVVLYKFAPPMTVAQSGTVLLESGIEHQSGNICWGSISRPYITHLEVQIHLLR
jgi:hypothetical protein